MHDVTKETVIPVHQIPKLPLFASRRPRLSAATAYNWAKGHGKVKLESFWIGQRIYTSLEALDRFIKAQNPTPPSAPPPKDQSGPSAPPPRDTSGPSAPPPPPSMLIQPSMERVVVLPEEVVERVQLAPEMEDEVERVVLLPEPPPRTPRVIEEDPTLYPPIPRERVPKRPASNEVEYDVPEGGYIYVPPLSSEPPEEPVRNRRVIEWIGPEEGLTRVPPIPPPPHERSRRATNG